MPFISEEVYNDPAVADREAGEAVPPTTHGDQKATVLRELHGCDDVGHASAPRDEGRETIDRPVPYLASILVAGILRAEKLAPETVLQRRDVQCSHRGKFRSVHHSYFSSFSHIVWHPLPNQRKGGGEQPRSI